MYLHIKHSYSEKPKEELNSMLRYKYKLFSALSVITVGTMCFSSVTFAGEHHYKAHSNDLEYNMNVHYTHDRSKAANQECTYDDYGMCTIHEHNYNYCNSTTVSNGCTIEDCPVHSDNNRVYPKRLTNNAARLPKSTNNKITVKENTELENREDNVIIYDAVDKDTLPYSKNTLRYSTADEVIDKEYSVMPMSRVELADNKLLGTVKPVPVINNDLLKDIEKSVSNVSDKDSDFTFRIPQTRYDRISSHTLLVRLGVLDDYKDLGLSLNNNIPDNSIQDYDVKSQEVSSIVNNIVQDIDWSTTLTRGQYIKMMNRVADKLELPDFDCCMGDKPDFSEIDKDNPYYDDIIKGAERGLYCTSEGADPSKPMTVEEFNKYLWKWSTSLPDVYLYNDTLRGAQAYRDYLKEIYPNNFEEISKYPDAYINMLSLADTAKLLMRDYSNDLGLDRTLTLDNFAVAITNASDLTMVYKEVYRTNSTCTPCAMLGVEKHYTDLYVK